MNKKYLYAILIAVIVGAIAIIAFVIKNADTISPKLDGMMPKALTENAGPSGVWNEDAVLQATSVSLGDVSYVPPEINPKNIKLAPEAGYIERRIFGNYKALTEVSYLPTSDSLSWEALGYDATIFAAETKELCHKNDLELEKYTSKSGVAFKIYGGSFLEGQYQYTMKSYQVSAGNYCYNFGVFEEFKLLETMGLSDSKQKEVQEKRNAESARVNSLLSTLADSVRIK